MLGANRLAEKLAQGYSRDDAEMQIIRENRGVARGEQLRENAPQAGSRARGLMIPEERDTLASALQGMGIDIDNPNLGEQERVGNAGQAIQFGQDQADWQVEGADDKDFGGKDRKRYEQQIKDRNDLNVNVGIQQERGKPLRIEGVAPAGRPVPRELREAVMLQEMGLAFPERNKEVPYKKGKDGKMRRVFAREDKEEGILKEFRIGNDGPQEISKISIANNGAEQGAYSQLIEAVNRGELSLDAFTPDGKRVGDLLSRMQADLYPENAVKAAKKEAAGLFKEERQNRREGARAQLREIAMQRAAEGNPLSKEQAFRVLEELNNPKAAQDVKAAAEAERNLNQNPQYNRNLTEQNIGRIEEIAILGGAKEVDKGGNIQRIVMGQDVERGEAIPMIRQQGTPNGFKKPVVEGYYGDVEGAMVQLGEVNFDQAQNELNAPASGRGQEWARQNVRPMGEEGGNIFGPKNINLVRPGRDFIAAAKGQFDLSDLADDIRSPQEFEAAVDRIIEAKAASGKPFMAPAEGDFVGGKRPQVAVENPGVADVMRQLRIPGQEQGKLADAINMMRVQKARGINAGRQAAYERGEPAGGQERGVIFEAPQLVDAEVPIAKVGNQKVKGKGVGAALRALQSGNAEEALREAGELYTTGANGRQVMLPNAIDAIRGGKEGLGDARQALIGVAGGDEEPRAKFIKQAGRDMSPTQRAEKYGAENAEVMNEVERRFNEDNELRAQSAAQTSDPLAQQQRALDSEFAARGRKVEMDKEAIEIGEIARLMRVGAQGEPAQGPERFGDRILGPAPKGRKLVIPNDSEFNQGDTARRPGGRQVRGMNGEMQFIQAGIPNRDVGNRVPENVFRNKQPIQEAPTPSIAPTPGDITGSQASPMADAGRGGWMGGDNAGRVADPWSSNSGPRNMTTDMKAVLNQLTPEADVRSTDPPGSQFRFSPDYQSRKGRTNREIGRGIERQNLRKRVGGGAAAAAGLTGLAALIGGERDQREQEQY